MANPVTHLEKTIAGEVQPVTHLEHVIAEHGGGGGGFTPTTAQLAAMNSGITSEGVEQISTNENNILLKANTSDVNIATANLQAQINNIVSGSTADSEVINARVGADGTSYGTLKTRLDAENNEISTIIDNMVVVPPVNIAGNAYNTYTLSGSGTALKLDTDANRHGYVISVKPNTTYSIIYTLDDATFFRIASYVETADTILDYYSRGYNTQSNGAVQKTVISSGNNTTITTGANDQCIVVTGNRSTIKLTQVVEGTYTDFVPDIYEPNKLDVYSKSESLSLVRDFKLGFVPYCYGNREILIGYNGSKISIFYPFTLTLGKKSDIPALRIPQADISVNKYDYVYINKADIPVDGIITTAMIHTAPYYSATIPISSDKIVLFSVSNDVVYSTFGVEVVDTNTVAWFGDSISMLRNIPYLACQKIGAYCNDVSIAGSVMYKNIPENIRYEKFGFYEFSKAIVSGDWSAQEAVASEFSGESLEHYQLLKTIDFSKINTLVALYGTNDYNASVATMQEFKAAMSDAITRLLTEFPNLKMYFISPPYRTNGTTVNSQGYTLYDYVTAEKEVCESFNIPFKDLYKTSNINSLTAEYYLVDGLHVNEKGEKLLTNILANFLKSN